MKDIINEYTLSGIKLKLKYILTKSAMEISSDKKRVILALAADYGNLGDLAITEAENDLLHETFPDCELIECPISKTLEYIKAIKKSKRDDDIIILIGGGNISNQYKIIETYRQFWIKEFQKNIIVQFPQSVDLRDENYRFKEKLQSVYSAHKKMILFTRDEMSCNILRKLIPNPVMLQPDVVLSFHSVECLSTERAGVAICMRDDKEKSKDSIEARRLLNFVKEHYEVEYIDTTFKHNGIVDVNERRKRLSEMWNKISSKKLVITDRLHGMIFSYITNTPCIAIDNSNGKVKNFYKTWFENMDCSVIFFEQNNRIENLTDLLKIMERKFCNEDFDFSDFEKKIVDFCKRGNGQ